MSSSTTPSANTPPHCQTCYTELPASQTRPYLTPCCSTPICERCLSRNPRLREYDPCLRCGDVRTAEGSGRVAKGRAEATRREREAESGQFTIGDDDDEAGEADEAEIDKPPSYRSQSPTSRRSRSQSRSRATGINGGQAGAESRNAGPDASEVDGRDGASSGSTCEDRAGENTAETEMEAVEVSHPVGRNDTVLSIARKYAADPHDLLTLNSLPPTALSSNPRILQTRRKIIISRRLVPRNALPSSILFDYSAAFSVDPEAEAKRETEKALKRFQLISKNTDDAVGRTYLALAKDPEGPPEGRHPLELGSGESMSLGAANGGGETGGKKKVYSKGEGGEERALEAFFDDEEWEREVGGPERVKVDGRWTVVGSGSGRGLGKVKG